VEDVNLRDSIGKLPVVWPIPRLGEAVLVVQLLLVDVREEEHPPAMPRPTIGAGDVRWWKSAVRIVVVGDRQRQLLEVSQVARPPGGGSGLLDGGNQPEADGEHHHRGDGSDDCPDVATEPDGVQPAHRIPLRSVNQVNRHGLRYSLVNHFAASASPTMVSDFGSHWIFFFVRTAMLPRWQTVADR
jgi:hypothetical protein